MPRPREVQPKMIQYVRNPPLDSRQLNELFGVSWANWRERNFTSILAHSLGCVCAFQDDRLIGYVNVISDGGIHTFILDTAVRPECRRQGVGTRLVREAAVMARDAGAVWLHVDFEPHLTGFYFRSCGFTSTAAGLLRLM